MRRRFFNAADNFVGGCYNKLSNEDIKRLGGKRPYVCQFNKIHIHIGPVLKDHDSDVSDIVFNSDWNYVLLIKTLKVITKRSKITKNIQLSIRKNLVFQITKREVLSSICITRARVAK